MTTKRKNLNLNDHYDVLLKWEDLKKEMENVDAEFVKFYGPTRIRAAGVRARKQIRDIIDKMQDVRKDLLKQKQDYESEYW
jgi:hypothetical protein